MKNILIIGATGQIGSELTMKLRSLYPEGNVVAGYIPGAEPKGALLESGPSHIVDITNPAQIAEAVDKYKVDTIYNLAALLSAVAEAKPQLAWKIGVGGLYNTLEVAREKGCAVFTPSSIGSFGPSTPHVKTPQDTVQRPETIYGVTKVSGELLASFRGRHPFGTLPGTDILRGTSGRRHHRLCRRHLLFGCKGRGIQMSPKAGHFHGHDVYARRAPCSSGDHGSRPLTSQAPQLLQHRVNELRSGDHRRKDKGTRARFQDELRA